MTDPLDEAIKTSKQLRNFEGDYHYPSGLLREGAEAIERLVAQLRRQRDEIAQARALLSPVCEQETLCGAIRNLQQAHLSEKGNAEEAEAQLRRQREALKTYGSHGNLCAWHEHIAPGSMVHKDCTCGLWAALSTPSADPFPGHMNDCALRRQPHSNVCTCGGDHETTDPAVVVARYLGATPSADPVSGQVEQASFPGKKSSVLIDSGTKEAELDARQLIQDVLAEQSEELTKEACDRCDECGSLSMCRYHSILSALTRGTWTEGRRQRWALSKGQKD